MKIETFSKSRILLVDDEPKVLEGLSTLLCGSFDINTTSSAEEGLRLLNTNGPYAVLVSDFRMPDMNGIEFISRAREISPCTIRIMLTGYAETDTAIAAVNTGEVFRFHTKPCPASVLRQTLTDALRKYHSFQSGSSGAKTLLHNIEISGTGTEEDAQCTPLWKLLTPKELRVAYLIRLNLSSKEIATSLNISVRTVETHRENIRRKLGIANEKINLQNYLSSLSL